MWHCWEGIMPLNDLRLRLFNLNCKSLRGIIHVCMKRHTFLNVVPAALGI